MNSQHTKKAFNLPGNGIFTKYWINNKGDILKLYWLCLRSTEQEGAALIVAAFFVFLCWLTHRWVDCVWEQATVQTTGQIQWLRCSHFHCHCSQAWRHVSTASDFGPSGWCKRGQPRHPPTQLINRHLVWWGQCETEDRRTSLYLRTWSFNLYLFYCFKKFRFFYPFWCSRVIV